MQRTRFTRVIVTLVLALAGALLVSGICTAAEFTADMVHKAYKNTHKGKIYVKGSKMRQDVTMSKGNSQMVIFRPDKKAVWSVQPSKKSYMRVSQRFIVGVDDPIARARMKQIGVMKKLGTAKINGYTCTKTQWTTKGKPAYVLTEWVSDKLKMPLRTEFKGPSGVISIEYKNIKEGGVSDSVFELPKGCKRVQTPTAPKDARR